jgi:Flp pilus assembly protein TadG
MRYFVKTLAAKILAVKTMAMRIFSPRPGGLLGERRSAVAVLFATMAIPMLGLVGLAIDFGVWNETYATLALADSSAALNAVKTANAAYIKQDPNYIAEGNASGKQWFTVELGQGLNFSGLTQTSFSANVVKNGTSFTATVTYSGTVKSVLGRLFNFATYPINVTEAATIQTAPYLEVVMMLDNSASMQIGATNADMQTLMQYSPCDLSNEYTASGAAYTNQSLVDYGDYQYVWNGVKYDGALTTPMTYYNNGSLVTATATASYSTTYVKTQTCPNYNNKAAFAGAPCAFACHWDNSVAAGLGNDLWHMARVKGVTTRLDVLKQATNQVLSTMQADNLANVNNLSVGIYTFDTGVTQVYPAAGCTPKAFGCEAGSDFTTAMEDVGSAPKPGSGVYTDTGIQPAVALRSGNNDDTAVQESMATLASTYVTAAGNGGTATTPRKVLFLITDGVEDDPNTGARDAMPSSICQTFKSMGYTVYVVYTTYYPVMHQFYLAYMTSWAEGANDQITANLQACSSATNANNLSTYYIEAQNSTQLTAALSNFLNSALQASVRFTQ